MASALTLVRVTPLAVVILLALAGTSQAQMTLGAPITGSFGAPAQAPFGAPAQPPFGMPSPQQQPPCVANFMPLRLEAQKRAEAIKAAAERHANPKEICGLFEHFTDAEAKMIQFLKTNSASCGIPAQALSTSQTNHNKTLETKNKVCSAAKFAAGERRGPGLGDALGMRTTVPTNDSAAAAGAFATLSGSALGTPAPDPNETGSILGAK